MKKLIFLDIDGVLHGDCNEQLSRLPLFEHYLAQLPLVEIIISSTWREDFSLEELRKLFSAELQSHIIAVTPILDYGLDKCGRQREIEAFLNSHALHSGNTHWIALDDWVTLFESGYPHLIVTDAAIGFTDNEGQQLLDWYTNSDG